MKRRSKADTPAQAGHIVARVQMMTYPFSPLPLLPWRRREEAHVFRLLISMVVCAF